MNLNELKSFCKDFHKTAFAAAKYTEAIDPFVFENILDELHQKKTPFFYWKSDDYSLLGIDYFDVISYQENNFNPIKEYYSRVPFYSNSVEEDIPHLLGANQFCISSNAIWNDFPASLWFVPKILFYQNKGSVYVSISMNKETSDIDIQNMIEQVSWFIRQNQYKNSYSLNTDISSLPFKHHLATWIAQVESIINQIERDEIQKAVLSRIEHSILQSQVSIATLIHRLQEKTQHCYTYCFYTGKDSVFFGASPELLLHKEHDTIYTESLAGTSSLREATDLNNSKNIDEHKFVSDFIYKALTIHCNSIHYENISEFKKIKNLLHLSTKFRAKLSNSQLLFSLLNDLYPSPAICGVPQKEAYQLINFLEKNHRGLYSGAIGWFGLNQTKLEVAIAIRCGLIQERDLYLFAGCGIVQNSNPLKEFEESELKLEMITSLFQYEKINQS